MTEIAWSHSNSIKSIAEKVRTQFGNYVDENLNCFVAIFNARQLTFTNDEAFIRWTLEKGSSFCNQIFFCRITGP